MPVSLLLGNLRKIHVTNQCTKSTEGQRNCRFQCKREKKESYKKEHLELGMVTQHLEAEASGFLRI